MKRTSLIFRHFIAFFATAFIRMDATLAANKCVAYEGEDSIGSDHRCNIYLGDCKPGSMCTFDDGTQVPVGYQRVNGVAYLLSTDNIPDCIGDCKRSVNSNNNNHVCIITQALDAKPYGQKIIENGVATYRCFCKCPDDNVETKDIHVCDVNSYGAPVHTGTNQCYVTGTNQIVSYGALKTNSYPWSQEKTATCKDNTYFTYDTLNERDTCRECPSLSSQCPVDIENDPNGYQWFICNSNAYEYNSNCYKCVDEHMTCDGSSNISCDAGYYLLYKNTGEPYTCAACTGNAATCNADGALSCMANWYLNGNTCVKCPDNATCTDAGFTCNDGYWKSKNKDSCEKDLDNATCVDDVGCACNFGYYRSGEVCVKCPDNATCVDDVGFACHSGYYRSGEVCATCPANHYTCAGDSFTCKVGYYKSGGACPECPDAGAAECDENGTTTQCKNGYLLKEEHCYGCGENAKCENGEFISCESSGFFGDENGCYACPANATCDGTSTGVCNAGYYGTVIRNGDTCQQCPDLGNAKGYSVMGSNTNICNCYLPVWKYENDQWKKISYTDDIGEFYFYSDLGSGADNDAYKNELVPAAQCTTE